MLPFYNHLIFFKGFYMYYFIKFYININKSEGPGTFGWSSLQLSSHSLLKNLNYSLTIIRLGSYSLIPRSRDYTDPPLGVNSFKHKVVIYLVYESCIFIEQKVRQTQDLLEVYIIGTWWGASESYIFQQIEMTFKNQFFVLCYASRTIRMLPNSLC